MESAFTNHKGALTTPRTWLMGPGDGRGCTESCVNNLLLANSLPLAIF